MAVAVLAALVVAAGTAACGSNPYEDADVYLVPLGDQPNDLNALADRLRTDLKLDVQVGDRVRIPDDALDEDRRQLVAERLIEALKDSDKPGTSAAVLIAVTGEDMYIRDRTWAFAFSLRREGRLAVVSSARMDPAALGQTPDPGLQPTRLRKMVLKNIGVLHYGLPFSDDPNSVMYDNILSVDDLDRVGDQLPLPNREPQAHSTGEPTG
jgi:predicted Zn-dependent protease